jgi:hypothetical protein
MYYRCTMYYYLSSSGHLFMYKQIPSNETKADKHLLSEKKHSNRYNCFKIEFTANNI